jgi:cytochrome c oxidase subunit 2
LDEHFYQQRRDFMKKHQFFFALLIAMSVSPLVAQKAQGEVPGRRIEVTAKRFSFAPAEITVKKGEPVDLVLKSVDVAHGVRFRELQVEVKAAKGGTSDVHFTPDRTGTFVGHCSVFCGTGHGSMALTLHVVD